MIELLAFIFVIFLAIMLMKTVMDILTWIWVYIFPGILHDPLVKMFHVQHGDYPYFYIALSLFLFTMFSIYWRLKMLRKAEERDIFLKKQGW